MCCSPWGHKELDMTERLNNNKYAYFMFFIINGIIFYYLIVYIRDVYTQRSCHVKTQGQVVRAKEGGLTSVQLLSHVRLFVTL